MGDKWETSANSCGRRHTEWETRQVWKTSVGNKCKLMRPKAPRVGDKCEGQVGDKCELMRPKAPRMGDKCGREVGDKCKLIPKAPRVGDGVLGRMNLHLSPTLISHSGCVGPDGFTLVFHLFPTLVSHSGCLGPHEFTLVSHLSPTCLPLWLPWAA